MFDSSIIIYLMSFNQKCTQKQAAMKRYNLKIFEEVAWRNGQVSKIHTHDTLKHKIEGDTVDLSLLDDDETLISLLDDDETLISLLDDDEILKNT